jgi:uncharacterized protein (DUF736 family)
MEPSKPVSVGGIWIKTSKKGDEYLSLSVDLKELLTALGFEPPEGIEKVNLAAFPNMKRTADNQPNYRISYFLK